MAEGIDVYTAYQTVTSWSAVRNAGKTFAYIKVSDGTKTRADGGYAAGAKAAGVLAGAYHYAQPGDAVAQANLLVDRAVAIGATDLAPALDLESPFTTNATAVNFAQAFLTQVKNRGHVPCIYGSNSMLAYVLPKLNVPGLKIWVARYGANPTVGYDIWQYADNGSVAGISASGVDLNKGNPPLNKQASAPTQTSGATSVVVLES